MYSSSSFQTYRQLCSERTCATSTSPLTYLEQRYDFSDSNYQKKLASLALKKSPFNFSLLCEAVEVLQLSKKLDMDALYDEYCVVLPHQQAIVQSGAPVLEKWATLLKHTHTPNMTALASFLLSVPITNASMERVFSLMTDPLHIQLQGLLHLCSEREGSPQCCTLQQEIQVQEET
jgi:hypothetical protein